MRTYVVSYPRSGSSWVRFLVSNILHPDKDIGWDEINKFAPDMNRTDVWERYGIKNPLVVKNHHVARSFYQKVIYLYRDGRDSAISYWRKQKYGYKKPEYINQSFTQFLTEFITGKVEGGLFGSWRDHVSSWVFGQYKKIRVLRKDVSAQGFSDDGGIKIFRPGDPISDEDIKKLGISDCLFVYSDVDIDYICIKYEDILDNPMPEAEKVIKFLGWDVESKILERAVANSTFDAVSKRAPGDGLIPAHSGMSGKWGGWKEVFSEKDLDNFWKWAGNLLIKLGYEK